MKHNKVLKWCTVNFLNIRTPKQICCNHSKIWSMWLYHRVMSPNDAEGMANSVDPDQTAPLRQLRIITVCIQCRLLKLQIFAITCCVLVVKVCVLAEFVYIHSAKVLIGHLEISIFWQNYEIFRNSLSFRKRYFIQVVIEQIIIFIDQLIEFLLAAGQRGTLIL